MNQWVLLLKNCSETYEYTVLGIGDFQEIVLKYYSHEIDGCKQIPAWWTLKLMEKFVQ